MKDMMINKLFRTTLKTRGSVSSTAQKPVCSKNRLFLFPEWKQSVCALCSARHLLPLILIFSMLFFLTSCSKEEPTPIKIVTIWDVPEDLEKNIYDFSKSSRTIQMQRRGFERGIKEYQSEIEFTEFILPEEKALSENATLLATLYSNEEVLMSVGASCDMHTMYAAMTNTFFSIPILIPFSDGDLVTATGAEYSMRMAPVSQKYADYIGTNIFPPNLKQTINNLLFQNRPLPEYEIDTAIFFADNFNGHESSVKITQKLMDNGLDIDYYRKYSGSDLLTIFNNCWNEENSTLKNTDILIIIAEDLNELPELGSILKYWDGSDHQPIILVLGYAPGTFDEELWSDKYSNLYVIRQALDMSNCPADIVNHEEAIGYAAGYITQKALENGLQDAPKEPSGWHLWLKNDTEKLQIHQSYVSEMRERVFSAFMSMGGEIPCFGKPMFDTSSSERRQLELVRYIDLDRTKTYDPGIIQSVLIDLIKQKTGVAD